MGVTDFLPTNVSQYSPTRRLLKREKCTGSLQKCQLPTDSTSNTTTIVVAVVVPVVCCLLFIGFFVWKNYRKGKKEALEDDDPDFNGDNTILPDIDLNYYENGNEGKFISKEAAGAGNNPFENSDLKYPTNIYSNQPKSGSPYNRNSFFNHDNQSVTNTINAGRYVDSFVLPYGEQTGSKRSLDEFARGLGSQYSAYAPAESDHSRSSSMSRSVHPFSKSTEMLAKTNLSQVVLTDDTTRGSSELAELKTTSVENIDVATTSSGNDDDNFEDSRSQVLDQSSRPTSAPSMSTAHLVNQLNDDTSNFNNTNGKRSSYIDNRASYTSNTEELNLKENAIDQNDSISNSKNQDDDDEDDPSLSTDEREKLRRLKSIYNVYFDRENSIKHHKKDTNEQVTLPPLPSLPSSVNASAAAAAPSTLDDAEERTPNLNINTDFDRNYASSVYPENPLNDYEPYQQDLHQQLQQLHYQYQQLPNGNMSNPQQYPQQYPQHYPQQYPQQQHQQQQQQYAYYTPQQRRMPPQQQQQQQPRTKQQLSKLSNLPTPSELNQRPYSSLNFYTDYQPKFAHKASSSPKLENIPQGINPMDQWSESQDPSLNLTPTVLSRNSVTMTNPTVISQNKLYKPAGSLAVAARNSPQMVQSPVFGNNNMQSPITPISGSGMNSPVSLVSNYGPPLGSKQDLRNYMGNFNV